MRRRQAPFGLFQVILDALPWVQRALNPWSCTTMYQSSTVQEDLATVLVADEAVPFVSIVPHDGAGTLSTRAPRARHPGQRRGLCGPAFPWDCARCSWEVNRNGIPQHPQSRTLSTMASAPSSRASAAGAWRRLRLIRWRAGSTLSTRQRELFALGDEVGHCAGFPQPTRRDELTLDARLQLHKGPETGQVCYHAVTRVPGAYLPLTSDQGSAGCA